TVDGTLWPLQTGARDSLVKYRTPVRQIRG
ncbi:hypothetical protein Q604_UNBC12838G0001, partial [human gut metagenome]